MSIQFKRKASSSTANKNIRARIDTHDSEEEEEDSTVSISRTDLRAPENKKSATEIDGAGVTQVYLSSREIVPHTYAGDATHTSEIDTAIEKDARTILERNILLNANGVLDNEPNVYRGQAGYKNFITKDLAQVGSNKHTGTQGPIRAPAFVRSTARFDYQPDICKDYKETGFCGYGDQCKFLHDRGDYKSGWQLEKEWDREQSIKKKKLEDRLKAFQKLEGGAGVEAIGGAEEEEEVDYSIDMDESLPFACIICREDFTSPIVTLCGHYFCEACALRTMKSDTRCPVCQKQTSGVFNRAHKLIKQLALKTGAGSVERNHPVIKDRGSSAGTWEVVD